MTYPRVRWLAGGILLPLLTIFVAGCSSTASRRCNELRRDGFMYATDDACRRCVDSLGPSNSDAIRGCAMGLDAAKLIVPPTP